MTPPGHDVLLIDFNAQPMTGAELVEFTRANGIGLVGIGAMTLMIAKHTAWPMRYALPAFES